MSKIQVQKIRPAVGRNQYLARGAGKKAIRVDINYNADGNSLTEMVRSEFEIYWLIDVAVKFAVKHGWKTIIVEHTGSVYSLDTTKIHFKNCSGYSVYFGELGSIVEREHFLNDTYFSPNGFWIK